MGPFLPSLLIAHRSVCTKMIIPTRACARSNFMPQNPFRQPPPLLVLEPCPVNSPTYLIYPYQMDISSSNLCAKTYCWAQTSQFESQKGCLAFENREQCHTAKDPAAHSKATSKTSVEKAEKLTESPPTEKRGTLSGLLPKEPSATSKKAVVPLQRSKDNTTGRKVASKTTSRSKTKSTKTSKKKTQSKASPGAKKTATSSLSMHPATYLSSFPWIHKLGAQVLPSTWYTKKATSSKKKLKAQKSLVPQTLYEKFPTSIQAIALGCANGFYKGKKVFTRAMSIFGTALAYCLLGVGIAALYDEGQHVIAGPQHESPPPKDKLLQQQAISSMGKNDKKTTFLDTLRW